MMYTAIIYTLPTRESKRQAVIVFKHGFDSRKSAIIWGRARAVALGIPPDVGSIATEAFTAFLVRTKYELLEGAEDTATLFSAASEDIDPEQEFWEGGR